LITKKPSNPNSRHLLLVHGAWHGAWCWEENYIPYFLEKGYTVHAFSMRGHGNSEGKGQIKKYRLKDYVSDLDEVIKSLSEMPVLIGHSMGGLVVQNYLEEHAVPGAVLLATVPSHGAILGTIKTAFRHPLAFLKTNFTLHLYPLVHTAALTKDAFFSNDIPPEKLDGYFSLVQDESYFAFLDMVFFKLPKPEKNRSKVLVVGAENDRLFSPKELMKTAKKYKTVAKIFPDITHDMMLEKNWRAAADHIAEWLKDNDL
jgi:pimeloyl-ACP methyl ester carboxylesterase